MSATQVKHPWRATLRTVLAVVVGLAGSWAVVIEALGVGGGTRFAVVSLAVAGAITRLMAVPAVDAILARIGLSAAPAPVTADADGVYDISTAPPADPDPVEDQNAPDAGD